MEIYMHYTWVLLLLHLMNCLEDDNSMYNQVGSWGECWTFRATTYMRSYRRFAYAYLRVNIIHSPRVLCPWRETTCSAQVRISVDETGEFQLGAATLVGACLLLVVYARGTRTEGRNKGGKKSEQIKRDGWHFSGMQKMTLGSSSV